MKNYKCFRGFLKRLSYQYDKSKEVDSSSEIALHWWNGRLNFGDVVNKFIVEKLSGKRAIWSSDKSDKEHHLVIGSVLQSSNDNAIVWGSGIISDRKMPLFKPKKVYAVRGPKTREVLLARGIECPEVYGDPALVLPSLIQPNDSDTVYKLGIIPHYNNKSDVFFKQNFPDDVKIIDIETDDVQVFIDEIASCELIVSSSLHGIIIADAYGVPAHHISFDDSVEGGEFKFFDYYLSVGRDCNLPIQVSESTRLEDLYALPKHYDINIDTQPLLDSCPFKK
ncbi:polysaccharide pyruvyl transferase family protein [Vibrio rotiferianus]|uniref:polysaccharide pyruvyl transferase family protein n=1 Tax=Vibrio rotiferianus TaxID=190895 RepID=UPI000B59C882|nr:polysaccharide pyruvyl transferase family protein [Vibrio rotiferianus]